MTNANSIYTAGVLGTNDTEASMYCIIIAPRLSPLNCVFYSVTDKHAKSVSYWKARDANFSGQR